MVTGPPPHRSTTTGEDEALGLLPGLCARELVHPGGLASRQKDPG